MATEQPRRRRRRRGGNRSGGSSSLGRAFQQQLDAASSFPAGRSQATARDSASSRPASYRRSKSYGRHLKYRKNQFLLSNFRLVVKPDAEAVRRCAREPDSAVDWSDVEQVIRWDVRTSTTEPTTCPICLEPPSPAKITKCGHVFCWGCILRCMGAATFCKCPVCFEKVHPEALRSYSDSMSTMNASDDGGGKREEAESGSSTPQSTSASPAAPVADDGARVRQCLGGRDSVSVVRRSGDGGKRRRKAAASLRAVDTQTVSVVPRSPFIARLYKCKLPAGSTVPMPVVLSRRSDDTAPPSTWKAAGTLLRVDSPAAPFSRVVLATSEYLQSVLQAEMKALHKHLSLATEEEQVAATAARAIIHRSDGSNLAEEQANVAYLSSLAASLSTTKTVLTSAVAALRDRYAALLTTPSPPPPPPPAAVRSDSCPAAPFVRRADRGKMVSARPPKPTAVVPPPAGDGWGDSGEEGDEEDQAAAGASGAGASSANASGAGASSANGSGAGASSAIGGGASSAISGGAAARGSETAPTSRLAASVSAPAFVPRSVVVAQAQAPEPLATKPGPTPAPTPAPAPAPAQAPAPAPAPAQVPAPAIKPAAVERDVLYQLASGDRVYLHPLSFRCLMAAHKHRDEPWPLPDVLEAPVVELNVCTLTQGMRSGNPQLRHLPLLATVVLCEVDLRRVVPPAALATVQDQVRRRIGARKAVLREDQREREAAAAEARAAARAEQARMEARLAREAEARAKAAAQAAARGEGEGGGAAPGGGSSGEGGGESTEWSFARAVQRTSSRKVYKSAQVVARQQQQQQTRRHRARVSSWTSGGSAEQDAEDAAVAAAAPPRDSGNVAMQAFEAAMATRAVSVSARSTGAWGVAANASSTAAATATATAAANSNNSNHEATPPVVPASTSNTASVWGAAVGKKGKRRKAGSGRKGKKRGKGTRVLLFG